MNIFKKAISPVIATALLLIVAVIAVVGFQIWFGTFSSGLFVKTQTQSSNSVSNTQIENLIGNSLYFKNGNTANLTITSVKINGVDCNYIGNLSYGITEINITNCISNLTTQISEVVVYTPNEIYSKKIYIKDLITGSQNIDVSNLNCTALNLSGGAWIAVPGNTELGTSDFCVMKYEAKNVGGIATSQATLTPWNSITQTDSKTQCDNLGSNYHLITNLEWTTIARNAELVSNNWNSSIVGIGSMWKGHTDGSPNNALSTDLNDLTGYNETLNSAPSLQKRILILSNNEIIWDFSGNVYEWSNDTCITGSGIGNWYNSGSWIDWTDSNLVDYEKGIAGPIGNYTSVNGIGSYYGCTSNGYPLNKGGSWADGGYGLYTTHMGNSLALANIYVGFRCVYIS